MLTTRGISAQSTDAAAASGLPAAVVVLATRAAAREPATEVQEPADAPVPITAAWRDGLFLQAAGNAFELRMGMLVHADGRFALDDAGDAVTSTFLVRRARVVLQGRLLQRFEFSLVPDFVAGLQDAFVEARFSRAFRIRAGRSKVPLGLERLQSASRQLFFERALPTALVPNRDPGVQVLGDLAGDVVSYTVGVMNGATDGTTTDTDTNDGKDVAGRLVVRPVARRPESPLAGLGFALSGSRGNHPGLPVVRTPLLQQTFLSYDGATGAGIRVRYSPQVFYYYKAFGGFGEYVRSTQPIRRGDVTADVAHTAWQVAASWVLTGENATDRGVRPRHNFAFGADGPGAVQIAARYHTMSTDARAIVLGLATPGSSRTAGAFTVGVNWYLNPYFKYVVNFERTVFDDGATGARPTEHALVFRTHLEF